MMNRGMIFIDGAKAFSGDLLRLLSLIGTKPRVAFWFAPDPIFRAGRSKSDFFLGLVVLSKMS
jgi:hypothetical protein